MITPQKKSVLIYCSNIGFAHTIRNLCQEMQIESKSILSPYTAIQLGLFKFYDLIVVETNHPEVDGFEFMNYLSSLRSGLHFLVIMDSFMNEEYLDHLPYKSEIKFVVKKPLVQLDKLKGIFKSLISPPKISREDYDRLVALNREISELTA